MATYYFKNSKNSEWIRHRNSKWIAYRKRLYLYWFNFLQEAEKTKGYKVDWTKYEGWGGSNVILGQKFDMWWEERWEELFGLENKNSHQRFPLSTTRPKSEGIRLCLLVWKYRNIKPETRKVTYRGKTKTIKLGNSIKIARAVYEYEYGISGEKKPRYSEDEFSAHNLNPESGMKTQTYLDELGKTITDTYEDDEDTSDSARGFRKDLQDKINKYLRKSKKIVKNVSEGVFP